MLFASLVPNAHTLTFNNYVGVNCLKLFVWYQVMPYVGFIVGDNFS